MQQRGFYMRLCFAKLVLPFFLLAFTLPSFAAPRSRKRLQESPLELKVSGPHFIHQGQKLTFKVELRNRSDLPILLPAPNAALYFQVNWTIADTSGRDMHRAPIFYCPVVEFGWTGPETLHMKGS